MVAFIFRVHKYQSSYKIAVIFFEEVEFLERVQNIHLETYIILMPFKIVHELKT